jgi:hypothetical protein
MEEKMNKIKISLVCLFILVVLLAGCAREQPDVVALQLAEEVNNQDLEGALELFADDAVVTSVSPEPFTGKAEIQTWLEEMMADDFNLDAEIESVEGDTAIEKDTMSMDSMTYYGIDTLTGTSVVTVNGGKIKTLNFSFSDETLADLQAAPFVSPEDIIGVWTVGTLMQINEDQTLRVANKMVDLDVPVSDEHPGSFENWTYDGMVITFQAEQAVGQGYSCTPDQVGVYFVKWAGTDLDRLKFKVIEDPCNARKGGMQYGPWAPVTQ